MCRIAGIYHPNKTLSYLQHTVELMCQLQLHGGPDDGGIYAVPDATLVLGNRRLSLLDLTTAGHQPMHYENKYSITYNGELYNYAAIKLELQQLGKVFHNGTDTEVILAAFSQWGIHSFCKFNGMFAFALWDNETQKIYLVRDSIGIKPLYYSTYNDGLAFASEMSAFSVIDYLQNPNKNVPIYQLAYGFLPEPITTLANVKPVPKGCYLSYDILKKDVEIQSFSFYSFSNKIKNEHQAKKNIFDSISQSVKHQMIADANVGMFLSGGIDSTIIASIAATNTKNKLHTLSIYFDEKNYSEKKYQDIVAEKIGSSHHSILLTEKMFHQYFENILADMDMPSCDGINTWFISKFASDMGLKAVLSGLGADELFGGYPSFKRITAAISLQKLPNFSLKLFSKANQLKYQRLAYLQLKGIRGLYLFLRGHFNPTQIAKYIGGYEKEVWDIIEALPASPIFSQMENKNMASWMETNIYMQDQLLRDADVMSMAHGLEMRVPFLDNDVIKTAFKIEPSIKYSGSIPKSLLVKSFGNMIPKEIWNRPKMGFSFPFDDWLKNSSAVNDLMQHGNDYAKKTCVDFKAGKLHWSRILSLIMIQKK